MALNNKEKYRYDRHLKLSEVGEEGQLKLKSSSVLVVGAGGLGCPVLMYLTAAGIGKIGIIDYDTVNETNLQRQILFTVNDIGNNKAIAASERLKQLNPLALVDSYSTKLTTKNAINLFSQYDIIVDATDNFSTRYLINDACILTQKPMVYGSIYKFEGQLAVFNYNGSSSYRCLFPDPPKNNFSCEDIGVLGVICGIMGAKQANEVIKIMLGIGTVLSDKLEIYNGLTSESFFLNLKRNEGVVTEVLDRKKSFELFDYDAFCETKSAELKSITHHEFYSGIKNKALQIIDIREEWEEPKITYPNMISCPMHDIDKIIPEISSLKQIVVVCQNGSRSAIVTNYLKTTYRINNCVNLANGLNDIDLSIFTL